MSENEETKNGLKIPEQMAMLPVKDVVIFPYMILPLFVGRDSSIKAVEESLKGDRLIFLATQKDIREDNPSQDSIYTVGTVAVIMRMRKLPDGRIKILAQGLKKAKVKNFQQIKPFFNVSLEVLEDMKDYEENESADLIQIVKGQLEKIITLGKMLSPDIILVVEEINEPGRLADLVTSNLGLRVQESQEILESLNPLERLRKVHTMLTKELEVLTMQQQIKNQAREEENKGQRELFLRDQMKAIKNELGESGDPRAEEINEFRAKIESAQMSEKAEGEALKQLSRLERMHPDASEAAIIRSYIEWLCDLPWTKQSTDKLDLKEAKTILDADHFDLEKVKERILEVLAVKKLKNNNQGPIICLSGPPGVGKTSLGKSIARAMGKEFVRISLGGVHDEAEIRGHRRTYVGAMPGRIIQALKQAGTNNPVMLFDEIDKLGRDHKGDPSSALLEVLDAEQNDSFRDHYLNLTFDLSNVFFLCTANRLDTIPHPLRDRMEIIQLSGYSDSDKIKIAKRYLIPKQIENNGLTEEQISFQDKALKKVVRGYTREAGLRNFERLIGSCVRKVAHKVALWEEEGPMPSISVTEKKIQEFLGPDTYADSDLREKDSIGVCTGLAWTQLGGEVLEVEVTSMKGKGMIKCTGSLGDVMKESCQASFTWIRSQCERFGVSSEWFEENELHVHFPSAATPKDGPSAGITITTAIVSHLTGIPIRKDVAMTGEVSVRGRVLIIGGLKEKSLAAFREGVRDVIIPHQNEKDLMDIPKEVKDSIKFHPMKHVEDVLEIALTQSPFVKKSRAKKVSRGHGAAA